MLAEKTMSEHRRTLPIPGSPPKEQSERRHPASDSVAVLPQKNIGPARTGRTPAPARQTPARQSPTPGRRTPPLSATPSPHRRSRPPGRKTQTLPPAESAEPISLLPESQEAWIEHGRSLLGALQRALSQRDASPRMKTSIQRAWAAWQLNGWTDREIARVAHLVRRAHEAIRDSPRKSMEQALLDCASVLYAGLPSAVRRRVVLDDVRELVRQLRDVASARSAVEEGTMRLLGWSELMRGMAQDAIQTAFEEAPPSSE
jgi:hypothetical protein